MVLGVHDVPGAAGQTGERRAQATHPARTKPELVADVANQVWSWDITKYDPTFPDRFGSIQHARQHCGAFYTYYNHEHRHSGIGLHTAASVHHGTAGQIRKQRQRTLDAAWAAHPQRFGRRRPQPPRLPDRAWINKPDDT